MYIPDGSDIDYGTEKPLANRYSYGWLGDKVEPHLKGWSDQELKYKVIEKFKSMKDDYIVIHHCGCHVCEICKCDSVGDNGSFVISWRGVEYRCPAMVIHYMEDHDYCPADVVIEAIFNGKWYSFADENESIKRRREEHVVQLRRESEEVERKRLSRMTSEEIAAEKREKMRVKRIEKEVEVKIAQLRGNGAFVE